MPAFEAPFSEQPPQPSQAVDAPQPSAGAQEALIMPIDQREDTAPRIVFLSPNQLEVESPEDGTEESPTLAVTSELLAMAEEVGVELTTEKLIELERLRMRARRYAYEDVYRFNQHGLAVTLWREDRAASVDFQPQGLVLPPEQRYKRNGFALDLMHGIQNFYMLTEGDYLEKPPGFEGITNPELATFLAQYYGCIQTHLGDRDFRVEGDYETVKKHAFSPATRAAEAKLIARLAEMPREPSYD
jgi:hypothetical protein